MKEKNIFWWLVVVFLVIAFIAMSVIMFSGLAYWFGTVYAIKALIGSYIVVAIVEVVFHFIGKALRNRKSKE